MQNVGFGLSRLIARPVSPMAISGESIQVTDGTSVSMDASGTVGAVGFDGALRARLGGALAEPAVALAGALVVPAALRPFGVAALAVVALAFAFATAVFPRAVFSSSRISARAALITAARCGSAISSAADKKAFAKIFVPRGARVSLVAFAMLACFLS
jgi:hypothetical protein